MDTTYLSSYRTATARLLCNLLLDQQADGAKNHPISYRPSAYYFFSHKPWCSKEHMDKTRRMWWKSEDVQGRRPFTIKCRRTYWINSLYAIRMWSLNPDLRKGRRSSFLTPPYPQQVEACWMYSSGLQARNPTQPSCTKYLFQSHQWIHTTHLLFIWWLNVIKERRKKWMKKKGGA